MAKRPVGEEGARPWVPSTHEVSALRDAAPGCRGCELYRDATQVVFGSGAEHARLFLVGEQPGDKEDLQGEPFVGPAGRVLSEALELAGIDRGDVYLTNAVKHFRHEVRPERGKRRLHKTPNTSHIHACQPWLEAELEAVDPDVVVALGSTAGKSLLGPKFKVTESRGQMLSADIFQLPRHVMPTIHPSAILRLRGRPERDSEFAAFVTDLTTAAAAET